ncbi:MAG: hypothetical protein IMF19_00180 [Proteobacteria bacterium]|nr:hypothetical protein [Pseudomonadota bacterium]
MTNQERDMGAIRKRERETRRPSKAKERLTVMIFKGVGKVRTLKISPHFLLWVSLFFIFYIVVTIFLTNLFIDYYRNNKMLADENAEFRAMLIKAKKSLEESKQHIALLDDYITEKKDQSPRPLSRVNHTESSLTKLVDIDELKVERNKSTIKVDFRIINKQVNEEPIGGYIFVLVSVKDSDKSEVWVYPNSPLKDGIPINYRSGQRFFIQRFKSISSQYTLNKSINRPLIFKIFVYDRNGTLILKKVVEA